MPIDDVRKDPALAALRTLRAIDVDRERAARIRRRCHRALRPHRWNVAPGQLLEPVVVALCAVYLSEVVRRALSLLQ